MTRGARKQDALPGVNGGDGCQDRIPADGNNRLLSQSRARSPPVTRDAKAACYPHFPQAANEAQGASLPGPPAVSNRCKNSAHATAPAQSMASSTDHSEMAE